jgi:gluconolactonase
VRYEHDGSTTVLAGEFEGKPFNSPNDAVVHPNGSIFFTDPPYGTLPVGGYEGNPGEPELPNAVYRIDPDGKITRVTDELEAPAATHFHPSGVPDRASATVEKVPGSLRPGLEGTP